MRFPVAGENDHEIHRKLLLQLEYEEVDSIMNNLLGRDRVCIILVDPKGKRVIPSTSLSTLLTFMGTRTLYYWRNKVTTSRVHISSC